MRPLGLYVHWPYCAKVCPYCNFTVAKQRPVDEEAWCAAFRADLARLAELTVPRPLVSIYFGGGTPSLMPFAVARDVISEADRLFGLLPDAEVTFEANPGDEDRFADFRALGLNRLSLGVQSLSDDELTYLGRNHDAAAARRAVSAALSSFDRVSLDFMYALPGQALVSWEASLADALALGAGHYSLYQLTIEPNTAFGMAAKRGDLTPLDDDRAVEMYELTQALTAEAGFPGYEVSNHAWAGEQAVHNRLYWDDADWLAIGPGAHGRLGDADKRVATEGIRKISAYTSTAVAERVAVEEIGRDAHQLEVLAGGMRPNEGLDLRRLGADAKGVLAAAQPFIGDGLLTFARDRLAATARGRLVLDYLVAELAEGLASSSARP